MSWSCIEPDNWRAWPSYVLISGPISRDRVLCRRLLDMLSPRGYWEEDVHPFFD